MQWFIAIIRLRVSDVPSYYSSSLTFCTSVTLFYVGLLGPLKTYIPHGRFAHRNQFPSCQFELLVHIRCGNDEEQTSLK